MKLVGDDIQTVIMALYDYRDNLQYNDYETHEEMQADYDAVCDLINRIEAEQ